MSLKKSKIMLADGFPTLPDFDQMETGEATKEDIYATQGIITHVQKTLKADGAYSVGDQFVYNGVLYTVTGSIASGANIVLTGAGANAELSDTIIEQIDSVIPYRPFLDDTGWTIPTIKSNRIIITKGGYKIVGNRVYVNILAQVKFDLEDDYYADLGLDYYDVCEGLPAPADGIPFDGINCLFLGAYSEENEKYPAYCRGRSLIYKATGQTTAILSIASEKDTAGSTGDYNVHIRCDYDIATT